MFVRERFENVLHVIDKTHIEHSIGLVEYGGFYVAQVKGATLDEIDEASGCAHHGLDSMAQRPYLPVDRRSTIDRRDAQAMKFFAEALEFSADLDG
jgi:hypothetical protein